MPPIAILLSVLGLVPFVLFGFGAVGHIPNSAERMLVSLIDYAAVVLGFAGGVHWGLALLPAAARPGLRFTAGIVPMVVGWLALLLAQMAGAALALVLLILGYLAMILTEHRAARAGLMPVRYMWMRVGFSCVAVGMMVIVLVLRSLGQTIVF